MTETTTAASSSSDSGNGSFFRRRFGRRSSLRSTSCPAHARTSKNSGGVVETKDGGNGSDAEQRRVEAMHFVPPQEGQTDNRTTVVTNGWGIPPHDGFQVRRQDYLVSKKKVPSAEYLFPARGVEVFLTDARPTHVTAQDATRQCLLNGRLAEVPTLVVNFCLPWGVLLFYFEIPSRFVPYVRAGYEGDGNVSEELLKTNVPLLQSLDDMTPSDRCVSRFLMNGDAYKNQTLKILPAVVQGPWVVRQVVGTGNKPAIVGKRMPIVYSYQPPSGGAALCLEATLDVSSSAAARGILNVARAHTQSLTLDLGFVVQGNQEDELPEQMLMGCRLYGIDPHVAPPFPSSAAASADGLTQTASTSSPCPSTESCTDAEDDEDDDDEVEDEEHVEKEQSRLAAGESFDESTCSSKLSAATSCATTTTTGSDSFDESSTVGTSSCAMTATSSFDESVCDRAPSDVRSEST